MNGGGGQGGSSATGLSPGVFLPPGQPEAAANLGNLINPLLSISANAGAGTPAGRNYPVAQDFVSQFLTGHGQNPIYNEFGNDALRSGMTAADYGTNTLFPQATGASSALTGAATGGLPFAGAALGQGFDPTFNSAISMLQNNPYYAGAMGGATQGAALGGAGANRLQGMGDQVSGNIQGILNSGFDPQSALFNRGRQQIMDQTNVVNAMSGLAGTPYGASVEANALGNYGLNWQDRQLGREQGALGAAGQAAGQAGSLYGAAPGLASSSAALPGATYTNQIGNVLQALDARNKAGLQGAAGYQSILGGSGAGLGQGQQLGLGGANALTQLGSQPYNIGAGITSNAVSGLTNATQLGNNQFSLPNQEIGNLMQYMGLGQNASQLSGQLGQQGFNQTAQGIGGALSGANTLFGGNGLLSGGGGLGGLFGAADPLAFATGGGSDALVAGGADLATTAASALPLAMSV